MQAYYRLIFIIILSFPFGVGWSVPLTNSHDGHITANYMQGFNFERWQGTASIDRSFGEKQFKLDERLTVWMHDITGYYPQWKLDQELNFELQSPLTQTTGWLLVGEVERFLDRRARRVDDDEWYSPVSPLTTELLSLQSYTSAVAGNSILKGHLGLGSVYHPNEQTELKGVIGTLYEDRSDRKQQGVRLLVNLDFVDDDSQLQASGWRDHLPNGSDFGWLGLFNGYSSFSDQADNRFNVAYSYKDRQQQYFTEGISNRRSDEMVHLSNKLTSGNHTNYPIAWNSELSRGRTNHIVAIGNYTDLSFAWDNDIVLELKNSPTLFGTIAGGVNLQQQKYASRLNQGRRTHFRFRVDFVPSPSGADSISLESRAIRYRFDTPDVTDTNDRDELRYVVSLQYGKKILPGFGVNIRLETDLNHLVYIYQPRSIENRWMRLITLATELPWEADLFNNSTRFAVSSHFSDYDYSPATESQSRVYRSFTAQDSLNVKFNRYLMIEADVALTVDDHGRFNWSEWVQDISEDGYGVTTAIHAKWTGEHYKTGFGWNWHRRRTTLHLSSEETEAGESVTSSGPLFNFTYPAELASGSGLSINLRGAILWVDDRLRGVYRLPDIHLSVAYTF